MDAGRLMKYNQENIMKQRALDKKQGVDKNTKSGRSAQTKPKNSAGMLSFSSSCLEMLHIDVCV